MLGPESQGRLRRGVSGSAHCTLAIKDQEDIPTWGHSGTVPRSEAGRRAGKEERRGRGEERKLSGRKGSDSGRKRLEL